MWMKLRELRALGFRFRRQAPIGRYIVDFVSYVSRVVIEVDGGQHGMHGGTAYPSPASEASVGREGRSEAEARVGDGPGMGVR